MHSAWRLRTIHWAELPEGRLSILFHSIARSGRRLLQVRDVTQVRARGLSAEAEVDLRAVIEKHGGETLAVENPRTTLEELFLGIVQESEARPGQRASGAKSQSTNAT